MVYKWITRALDVALPHLCLCCGARSQHPRLCEDCRNDLPWIEHACAICSIPLPHEQGNSHIAASTCGDCQTHPPEFDRCLTPLRYEFPVPSMLTRFKQQHRHAYGAALADVLGQHLKATLSVNERPQCIVPVPLHRWKQARRGFNQAQLLAIDIGRQLDIAVSTSLVKRSKQAPAQHTLSASERQHNLRDAFVVAGDCSHLTHIVVLDDVVTTMATANTLALLLKQRGVQRVDVWAVARTPRHH